jgi:4-amino-4-deoxy-L-arabinose transferase-like glycosyltransferase
VQRSTAWRAWFLGLLALALAVRLGMALTYAPAHDSDTQSYLNIARLLHNLTLHGNDATRPPVYPGLIALLQLNEYAVWAAQSIMGVALSAMLFLVTWRLTGRTWLAFIAGAAHTLNLAQVFFEGMILSETTTTFLFALSLTVLVFRFRAEERWPWTELLLGLLAGLLALTRPQMLFWSAVLVPFAWLRRRAQPWRVRAGALALLAAPILILVLGWSLINWRTAGYFGPTSLAGYSLSNMVGNFMEYAPDEYATVRDIYLHHRAERIAATGNHAMTVWAAFFDLSRAADVDYSGLSRLLTEISLRLMVAHPLLYLGNVVQSWLGFWKVPIYWDLNLVRPEALVDWLRNAWKAERALLLGTNFLFLLMGGLWLVQWLRRRLGGPERTLLAGWGVVLIASLTQALVEYGENPRYGAPFESLMAWTVIVGAWLWAEKRAGRAPRME